MNNNFNNLTAKLHKNLKMLQLKATNTPASCSQLGMRSLIDILWQFLLQQRVEKSKKVAKSLALPSKCQLPFTCLQAKIPTLISLRL